MWTEAELEYRKRFLAALKPVNREALFRRRLIEVIEAATPGDYHIEEFEGEHLLDKRLKITTPGFVMPIESQADADNAVYDILPISYRITFEWAS